MNKVEFHISGRITRARDSAIVLDEEPLTALVEAARQTISTDVVVTCAGVAMHLAAWEDPEHWSDEWAEHGLEPHEVANLVAGAVRG